MHTFEQLHINFTFYIPYKLKVRAVFCLFLVFRGGGAVFILCGTDRFTSMNNIEIHANKWENNKRKMSYLICIPSNMNNIIRR